ncbi:hypothetical protein Tco_1385282 [Tanacetum coccineum]
MNSNTCLDILSHEELPDPLEQERDIQRLASGQRDDESMPEGNAQHAACESKRDVRKGLFYEGCGGRLVYSYDKLFTLKIHHSGRFTRPPGRRYRLAEISYVDLIDYHLFSIEEYVAMLDELCLGDGRLLFSHFKIPCTSLDDRLVPLMEDEDVVKLLEYMLRFREVDVCVEKDVSVVEQHMIEVRFRNEHSEGLLIEEIV